MATRTAQGGPSRPPVTSPAPRSRPAAGTTFVELMVAISVVAVALMVMLTQISISFRENAMNEDRTFAYRKAMSVLSEIQNGIERGDIADAEHLDKLADVSGHNVTLTTVAGEDGLPLPPDHPMSGNVRRLDEWLWARVLEVSKMPLQEQLRYVRVKVYKRRDHDGWDLQATVGALVSLSARAYQASKYYDVYVIAIAEAPSLWLPLASVQALIETAAVELQTIENGLKLRLHWITKLGYGRDESYTPFVNSLHDAADAAPFVYWYPGRTSATTTGSLYVAGAMGGRVRTEAGVLHDYDEATNPVPYAVADQFNHCQRLPRAQALFERRVAAGLEDPSAPPLQLLLEAMVSDPEAFRNAIFVNLHGPGLPLPPLRNYSDAAKDPIGRPGVRVVTHPERLWTRRDTADGLASERVALRVYAYKTDPELGPAVLSEPITLQIKGLDLTADVNTTGGDGNGPPLHILRLSGGVDVNTGLATGDSRQYAPFFQLAPAKDAAVAPHEMSYEVGYAADAAEPYTWIKLYNTPLVAPPVDSGGLAATEQLYGMEYIPSPVGDSGFFVPHLGTAGSGPKNTARWRILLPPRVFHAAFAGGFGGNQDAVVEVVTRIGEDMDTGTTWPVAHQPHNISSTWAWWTALPSAVPVTERYQWQGDPRHNPYLDLVVGGASFEHGYNWHFDDLREPLYDASAKWPCLDRDRLQDGFGAGHIADAPRLLQLLREGLQACGGVYVNPCGPLAQALLLGGEIAAPGVAPGEMPQPINVDGSFLGRTSDAAVDTVTAAMVGSSAILGRHVVLGSGSDPFWAMDWLGELCPDSAYASYLDVGNLPTGALPGTYHREPRRDPLLPNMPPGTDFGFAAGAWLGLAGTVAAADSGTLGSTLLHKEEPPATASVRTAETEAIMEAVGDDLPSTLPSGWPFATNFTFPGPLPYFSYTTSYPKSTAVLLETHYSGSDLLTSAGMLALRGPGDSPRTAFLTLLGLSPATADQHRAVGMAALMLGLRSFHRAGEPGVLGRVTQVPLVEIIDPVEGTMLVNPDTILLRWKTEFFRFDGQPYTTAYPAAFSEPESNLVYSVLYSRDTGLTWRYVKNNAPAVAGQRPSSASLFYEDGGVGNESLLLPAAATDFVGAEYVLRVECYHKVGRAHLAAHQVRVLVTRP